MKTKAPTPVCTAFLTCRLFANDPKTGDDLLVGMPRAFVHRNYPAATPISFFIRCTSAHGEYHGQIQLQNGAGEVVWKDGPPDPYKMSNPLELYDLRWNLNVIFPDAGVYQFVAVINGDEIARQTFHAKLGEPPLRS